jgi:UDP-glucuronate 4-epimerase
MHILVTGGAGFIGSHLVDALLDRGYRVTTVDNFDPYYPAELKRENIAPHLLHPEFTFVEGDIRDEQLTATLPGDIDVIVHLAAKAGVRPSIMDPAAYVDTNIRGTQNLLEMARKRGITQFVFASSSSVYGVNPHVPWHESDVVLQPISPYAGTKVSGELMGHVYSHLYGIRFLALRFFTVYGPRQRPDLAINSFGRKIFNGEEIPVFGDGSTRRDYTYVGDIVSGILSAIDYSDSSYEIINLGNGTPVTMDELLSALEDVMGKKAIIKRLPEQPGDVPQTYADITRAQTLLGYQPRTTLREGMAAFRDWMLQRTLST